MTLAAPASYCEPSFTHSLSPGPLTKTLVDYWRLVWQERVHAIVMVTNLREDKKLKCQQYWPENDCKDFGPFRVTLTDTQLFANFTIRLFQVEVSGLQVSVTVLEEMTIKAFLLVSSS